MWILNHLNNILLNATKSRPNNVSTYEVNSWRASIDFFLICFVFETRLIVKATLTWNLHLPHAPLPVLKMGATMAYKRLDA